MKRSRLTPNHVPGADDQKRRGAARQSQPKQQMEKALKLFAQKFVRKSFRERFVHEALKKPERLMYRVCHAISDVFEHRFKNGRCEFNGKAECFFYVLTGDLQHTTWAQALERINRLGGGGYLIIDASGDKFYAQSEGTPPPDTYSGQC